MRLIDVKKRFDQYKRKKSLRYGLPFLLFCISASFGLREVTQLRYIYRNTESFRIKAIDEGYDLKKLDDITIEAEHEKLKEINLDEWENVRIERPWEK